MRFLLFLLFLPGLALADDWQALDQPGAIAIMRHALAPGAADPADFTLGDCSTQRNLDARGRAQARAIGAAFRARGIRFDRVYTSQWCRCRETAELLGLGPVVEAPALNSFFADFSKEAARTEALKSLISETSGPRLMVTHQVNISALTGRSTRSGEVVIIRMVDGAAEVLGAIMIAP
ncbi:histidine phosphatase family protein [Roseovarius sp. HI0049]|nr:histidine phosphatase family protein [Roseovarius sp. HI0049]